MNSLLRLSGFFAFTCTAVVQAAEPSTSKVSLTDTSGYFLQLVSGLGVVLLSIAVLAWLLKRINRLPNRDLKDLELIASLSVGQRERVVIVRAGNTELVLGVAPGSISKLGEIASSPTAEQDEPAGDDEHRKDAFSALIAKVRKDTAP
ncbi:MAG: flagellar biosynthetic protein FliO [Cellvibrionales bacterium]|nr:MAG: flagellar biosynthetic protein FliO [Cellvibrionales bacterium]PCJ36930.1 MAG: flagellar biosynthetic protein FliO [Cellvibrionales bacterium]